MGMAGSRTLTLPSGHTLFEVLGWFRLRARPMGGGRGVITVVSRESGTVAGLKGRRFTGCAHGLVPEVAAEAERVPPALCGASAFSLPRAVKYVCRGALPLCDVDAVNCYYQVLLGMVGQAGAVQHYLADRERLLRLGMETHGCSRDAVKASVILLSFFFHSS